MLFFFEDETNEYMASKVALKDALAYLAKSEKKDEVVFRSGTLEIEVYKPELVDLQQPHERDEAYIVISGEGFYEVGEERMPFVAGDFLFAPAGVQHRFVDFSDDFVTWVIFYGPNGGENVEQKSFV